MSREERSLGADRGGVNAAADLWAELSALIGSLVHPRTSPEGPARLAAITLRKLGASRTVVLGRRPGKPGLTIEGSAGFESVPDRAALLEYGRRIANWVERSRSPLVISSPAADARFENPPRGVAAARAFPLSVGDDVLGVFVVFDEDPEPASLLVGEARDLALLGLAHLAALSLDRDRGQDRAWGLARDLEEHERRLVGAERRAVAGEWATELGRDLQDPLTGIAGLASRVAESLDPADPRRSLLERVVEESARLARVVAAPEEFGAGPGTDVEPDTLNRIMSETLALVREDIASARLRLTERLGASLPFMLLDADLTRRVFLNMLRAGIAGAGPGGRLKVETKRRGDVVEVLVAADGNPAPGHVLDTLWAPFRPEGRDGDPALTAVRALVKDHRATVSSRSTREWPFALTLVVPISGNQDRRRGGRDRRRV